MRHLATFGASIVKRTVMDGDTNIELPSWAFLVILLDIIVFLPAIIYVSYTLENLYPVLAMVEDPTPPAYEPLSGTNEDNAAAPASASTTDGSAAEAGSAPSSPPLVTSSIRSIDRLLRRIGGWRSSFRGLGCYVAMGFAMSFLFGVFSAVPFVPTFLATLLASLALVQVSAAWVHQVMTVPDARPFWRRLPPFKRAFEATCMPVLCFWAAQEVSRVASSLVAVALGLPMWDPSRPGVMPQYQGHHVWKSLVVLVVALTATALLVIPAHVVLARVQASLLPDEDETILPFDRSFQGRVEPAVVSGKGYVTMRDAWQTFPAGSWRRLVLLYVKIFAVSVCIYGVMMAVIIPEGMLFAMHGKKVVH